MTVSVDATYNLFDCKNSCNYVDYVIINILDIVGVPTIDVYNSINNITTISKIVGDMFAINVDLPVEINLLICYIRNYSALNLSENDCLKCLVPHHYHQCDYRGIAKKYFHSFQISFNYSLCSLQYHVTLFKHHVSVGDSGTLVVATYSGESYEPFKTINLHVNRHTYNYVYVALIVVVIILVVTVLFLVCQRLSKIRGIIHQPSSSKLC